MLHDPSSQYGLPQQQQDPHHQQPSVASLPQPVLMASGSMTTGHPGSQRISYSQYMPQAITSPLYHQSMTATAGGSRLKRRRLDDLDLSNVPVMPDLGDPPSQAGASLLQHTSMGPGGYGQNVEAGPSVSTPIHHHHRLPETSQQQSMRHYRHDSEGGHGAGGSGGGGAPSVIGQPGMPEPAARPRGPKLKFTAEDDQLLLDLKENKSLTWKQIADFFPGRSSGTLQVRYCTKLKAKTTQWTDETDQRLRSALQDYEHEKWRIVANKVGTGFTPAACRERFSVLMGEELPSSQQYAGAESQ